MPGRPDGSTAALVPTNRPLTRDDPAYLRLLKLVLAGLGGAVPLEADDDMADETFPTRTG
ncbi:hypothetical protein [Streptomyces sp. NPDC059092]|uniref:hypothetical protein n=1 Tax=Streptomyces sp. NPDC059092 TaxID=3346725 RepID=UPI00368803A9